MTLEISGMICQRCEESIAGGLISVAAEVELVSCRAGKTTFIGFEGAESNLHAVVTKAKYTSKVIPGIRKLS